MKRKDGFLVGLRLFGVLQFLDCANEMIAYAERERGIRSPSMVTLSSAYLVHGGHDVRPEVWRCGPGERSGRFRMGSVTQAMQNAALDR